MPYPFKDPFQETVIAKYDDPRDGFCLGIVVEHDGSMSNEATVAAMRAAAAEYAGTPASKADDTVARGCFNWGDFVNGVPDAICIKHGFRVVDTFVTHLVVDHDEHILQS